MNAFEKESMLMKMNRDKIEFKYEYTWVKCNGGKKIRQ